MKKTNETIRPQTEVEILGGLLENIAQELAPLYQGELVVAEKKPSTDFPCVMTSACRSYIYIVEERKVRGFLGIFPKTERTIIFAIDEGFYGGAYDLKNMNVYLGDDESVEVIKKNLDQFIEEHNITKVQYGRLVD